MRHQKGFSLIELMVAVAVIAILTSIALPSFMDYIRKTRRSDALNYLVFLQAQQEKWRANNTTYGTLPNIGGASTSPEGYYDITVSANNATGYTITATAKGNQASDDEDGVFCTPLTLVVNAANPRGLKGPTTPTDRSACWE